MPPTITPVPITAGIGTKIAAVQDGSGNVYQGVAQYNQITNLTVLQTNAVANGNGVVATTDGLDGSLNLLISNGVGTCTVTVQGSFDNFATAQDIMTVGVYLLADSNAGVYTTRNIQSGAINVAANTSSVYALTELYPYVRAVISNASGLGAGTNVTGTTIKLYGAPI